MVGQKIYTNVLNYNDAFENALKSVFEKDMMS